MAGRRVGGAAVTSPVAVIERREGESRVTVTAEPVMRTRSPSTSAAAVVEERVAVMEVVEVEVMGAVAAEKEEVEEVTSVVVVVIVIVGAIEEEDAAAVGATKPEGVAGNTLNVPAGKYFLAKEERGCSGRIESPNSAGKRTG